MLLLTLFVRERGCEKSTHFHFFLLLIESRFCIKYPFKSNPVNRDQHTEFNRLFVAWTKNGGQKLWAGLYKLLPNWSFGPPKKNDSIHFFLVVKRNRSRIKYPLLFLWRAWLAEFLHFTKRSLNEHKQLFPSGVCLFAKYN